MEKKINTTEKFCTKCGKKFLAVGREVICPECREAAAEATKKAAVMRAKRASWNGESVPVRISGRASTVIRRYGAANNLPFAAALDELLKASDYFKSTGATWESVEPYRSHRRDKHTTESTAQEVKTAQDVTSKPQDVQDAPQEVKQAAKVTSKKSTASTNKKASSKPSKPASVKKEG